MVTPLSTYRVQLHGDFGFDAAASIADYLEQLGVSHLYASPYLQAAAGSTHGYDVVNHGRVNDELGGTAAHQRLSQALMSCGLGHILDIVPNHMAIPGRENAWWWDVLKQGRRSPYAEYFDIDWTTLPGKDGATVLVPILGDHYGIVLESGQLQLDINEHGEVVVRYFDHELPIDPTSLATPASPADLEAINEDVDALDDLLNRQNFRLAHWRVAADELDYRRFFDVNTLVGLRAERPDVFRDTHALVLHWLDKGVIDGVRIDHIDGLRDPLAYLRTLRTAVGNDAWIVVEKILEPNERLPASWPVQGTSGYDALNLIGGLFIQPDGESAMSEIYTKFTNESAAWEDCIEGGKAEVLEKSLISDLKRLTDLFAAIADSHRLYRDYTRREVEQVLFATLVAFPVYRSYVSPTAQQVTRADEDHVQAAIDAATAKHPDIASALFQFLGDVLTLKVSGDNEAELAFRFQQLSGPVMAKGVEDTAFYRFNRMLALNEVGGDPGRFARRPDDFHEAAAEMQRLWPSSMVASTTHDTKRSEDVRYRLAVLSEIPEQWGAAVARWSKMNEIYRRPSPDGADLYPDRNLEYAIYQTLVGAHPLSADRLAEYAAKASKEAKQHTAWLQPNDDYDNAVKAFVHAVIANKEFTADLEAFVGEIVEAGYQNSLAATAIKLTMPGVPDIYQGTELWDLSLVDPDNRRPVDFALRRSLLARLETMTADEIAAELNSGLPKLYLTQQLLTLRMLRPECFDARSTYEPLSVAGKNALHTMSFMRGGAIATVVPRLTANADTDWSGTIVTLPDGQWRNVLTTELVNNVVDLGEQFRKFPVAVLEKLS